MNIASKRIRVPDLIGNHPHIVRAVSSSVRSVSENASRFVDTLHSKMVRTSSVLKSLAIGYFILGLAVTKLFFFALSGAMLFFIWFTMLTLCVCAFVHWAIRYVKEGAE